MRYMVYILKQTGRNLSKTWKTQIMTLITVTLSVLIFAFFFLIYINMLTVGNRLGDNIRLTLYLENEIVPELQEQYREKITKFNEVEKILFISRAQAFENFGKQLGQNKIVLDSLGSDFLPPSIEIYPKKTLLNLTSIVRFSDYLATLPGVIQVQSGHNWLERFGYFINLLSIVVFISGGLLILTTTFVVSHTIRMTIATREAELEILRLLGASSAYIRTPLLIEGMLQGLIASGFGVFSLYMIFYWISTHLNRSGIFHIIELSFFSLPVTSAIILTSVTLCTVGSLLSMRNFLRI